MSIIKKKKLFQPNVLQECLGNFTFSMDKREKE